MQAILNVAHVPVLKTQYRTPQKFWWCFSCFLPGSYPLRSPLNANIEPQNGGNAIKKCQTFVVRPQYDVVLQCFTTHRRTKTLNNHQQPSKTIKNPENPQKLIVFTHFFTENPCVPWTPTIPASFAAAPSLRCSALQVLGPCAAPARHASGYGGRGASVRSLLVYKAHQRPSTIVMFVDLNTLYLCVYI